MKYGELPILVETIELNQCREMMFYQYLPIKLAGSVHYSYERRLDYFIQIINVSVSDFIKQFGFDEYCKSYVYVTAKNGWVSPIQSFNRPGYHSDGFMTNDINYIWCDKFPTVFNTSLFDLTQDDSISLSEMESQALKHNEFQYKEFDLLRLNQFNIHKVCEISHGDFRTFLKVSFSKDKYDLIGNSHNYEIDYSWNMKPRNFERNIPQTEIKK